MTMPFAYAAVKDAARRCAVPPTAGILDSRFAAGQLAFVAEVDMRMTVCVRMIATESDCGFRLPWNVAASKSWAG